MSKVIIRVDGGMVTSVHTNDPDITVWVLDFDMFRNFKYEKALKIRISPCLKVKKIPNSYEKLNTINAGLNKKLDEIGIICEGRK